MAFPFWADLLLTATHTSAMPDSANPDVNYIGFEGGLAFPVFATRKGYVSVRPSIGVAHQVGGGTGPQQTTFNWSIGVHCVWPKF